MGYIFIPTMAAFHVVSSRKLWCRFSKTVIHILKRYSDLYYTKLEAHLDGKTWKQALWNALAVCAGVENIHKLQQSLARDEEKAAATG